MNDFDDLDTVFGPLRSDATPDELAGESSIVDAMARNHRTTKGSTMFSSRRARVAAFVAAGVIGFGGVAAAGPGGPLSVTDSDAPAIEEEPEIIEEEIVEEEPELVEEEIVDEPEIVEEEPVEEEPEVVEPESAIEEITVDEADAAELPRDDPDTYFREDLHCLEGNHGKTVSAAARGDAEYLEKIGEAVYTQSQVAQSSCGKDYEGVVVEEEPEIDETLEQEVENDEDDDDRDDEKKSSRADKPGKPDHAGKQGKGNKGKKD
jgi:hypothetical protein